MKTFTFRPAALCLLLPLWICLSGCSSQETYPALTNKGLLPLSDSDAYMGANYFMSKEMEKSSFLYSFVKTRGAPTAIELVQGSMQPHRLIMFYAREQEVYVASPADRDSGRQWIVRGPYQIDWRDNRQVQRVQMAMKGEPVFSLWNKPQRFPAAYRPAPERTVKPVLPPLPPPPPPRRRVAAKPKPPVIKAPAVPASPAPSPTPDPAQFKPLNIDQQALMMSQGYAERAENGDLIHTVKVDTQTFERISRWYTGAPGNAGEIAKFNGADPAKDPLKGERIRIPLGLIKQFKVMPDDFS